MKIDNTGNMVGIVLHARSSVNVQLRNAEFVVRGSAILKL